jgi:DNA-binding transcriptional LysR family regulator
VELRQLRYFQAIVEAQSFSAAARQIHIAQPALTRQIKALESELGVSLLERHVGGIRLTPAGSAFYRDIAEILADLESATNIAKMIEKGMQGEISLGVTVMILWVKELSDILKSFRSSYPDVMLKINTLLSGPQVQAIEIGKLDAGILMFPPKHPNFGYVNIYQDSLALVAPSESPLAQHPPKRLKDINNYGFVWFDRVNSPMYHDELLSFFHRQEFIPNVIEKGSDAVTMLSLVASGVGCTIVPRVTLNGMPEGLTIIELDDLTLPIHLQLVWRKDRTSPILDNLINIALKTHK